MKNFEKEARNQLENHKSSLEVKPLWEKINLELRPHRKKPALFWWPLGISLLGLSLFLLLNPIVENDNTKSIAESLNENKSSLNSNGYNSNSIEYNSNSTSINNARLNNLKSTKSENDSKINKPNSVNSNNHDNSFSNIPTQNALISKKAITHNTYKLNKVHKKATLIDSNASNNTSVNLNSVDVNSEKETTQNNNDIVVNSNKDEYTFLNKLESIISSVKSTNNIESISSIRPLYKNYNRDRFSLYVSLYGGYGYPIRLLSAKDSNNKSYQDSRLSTETALDVWQFDFLIGTISYSGLFVESGFEYNRINERFDWNKTITDSLKRYVATGFYLNNPEDTTFLYDSIDIIRKSKYSKKIYNNYTFYSIPLIVGYEFNRMARTRFYAKVGILVNLRLDNNVAMLDEKGLPINYEDEPNPLFKSKIGFTPFISAGVKYSFNNTMELFGELNYKNLNDISESSYILKQSYNLISANIGLQFNF